MDLQLFHARHGEDIVEYSLFYGVIRLSLRLCFLLVDAWKYEKTAVALASPSPRPRQWVRDIKPIAYR